MNPTVADVMAQVQNHFPLMTDRGRWPVRAGIPEGVFPLHAGAWVAVDGVIETASGAFPVKTVCQAGEGGGIPALPEGEFEGRVMLLNPPGEFLALCEEIAGWCRENPRGVAVRYGEFSRGAQSEGWERVFAARLRRWRRMFADF